MIFFSILIKKKYNDCITYALQYEPALSEMEANVFQFTQLSSCKSSNCVATLAF